MNDTAASFQKELGIGQPTIAYSRPRNVSNYVTQAKLHQAHGRLASTIMGEYEQGLAPWSLPQFSLSALRSFAAYLHWEKICHLFWLYFVIYLDFILSFILASFCHLFWLSFVKKPSGRLYTGQKMCSVILNTVSRFSLLIHVWEKILFHCGDEIWFFRALQLRAQLNLPPSIASLDLSTAHKTPEEDTTKCATDWPLMLTGMGIPAQICATFVLAPRYVEWLLFISKSPQHISILKSFLGIFH